MAELPPHPRTRPILRHQWSPIPTTAATTTTTPVPNAEPTTSLPGPKPVPAQPHQAPPSSLRHGWHRPQCQCIQQAPTHLPWFWAWSWPRCSSGKSHANQQNGLIFFFFSFFLSFSFSAFISYPRKKENKKRRPFAIICLLASVRSDSVRFGLVICLLYSTFFFFFATYHIIIIIIYTVLGTFLLIFCFHFFLSIWRGRADCVVVQRHRQHISTHSSHGLGYGLLSNTSTLFHA